VPKFDPIADLLRRPASIQKMKDRLAAFAPERGPDECWEWAGARNKDGYGRTKSEDGLEILTHRLSFALEAGASPGALSVLHSCDNPPCRNPAHLFAGTNADNVADRVRKGRCRGAVTMAGEINPAAKLTPDDVEAIMVRIGHGETNRAIAADYPVSDAMISRIRHGKSWRMVVAARIELATSCV
jgi:hypothetical protein